MTFQRKCLIGSVGLIAVLVFAIFGRPPSLRKKLESSGVVLVSIPRPEKLHIIGNLSRRAGYYAMPVVGEARFKNELKRLGFQAQFGKSSASTTTAPGAKMTWTGEVLTKGWYYRPFFDYDRVWITEYEGATTIVFDPDCN